jgi:aspartate racemase
MSNAIGVIGGVGPYAGIDLVRKIFDNTSASSDQEHIDLYMTSCPSLIVDRTEYLLRGGENPAIGIISCFEKLALMGATVVAIPCNTAHAPAIFGEVLSWAAKKFPKVLFLNMIEETCNYLAQQFPNGGEIGLMATLGTHTIGIYNQYLSKYPMFRLLEPDQQGKISVHEAIYSHEYGIKAVSPVTVQARDTLLREAGRIVDRGADALILGCTELPLAIHEDMLACSLIDPTNILARAAIRETEPDKLRS